MEALLVDTKKSDINEWIKAILIALLLAVLIRSFVFVSYEVRGESMEPTAYEGEMFIVNKLSYEFSEPKRFDLIVFHATETDDYIKRIIGLPGDTIRMEDDILYINDEPYEEPYLDEWKEGRPGKYTQDFVVEEPIPDGYVFVLGDNRPRSSDSRAFGPVPLEEIVGKVGVRFWPVTKVGVLN
ncbi:signal peptidase (type I) [Halalkalibacterium halodurans C-125]|uniref:Signal peptidase I n=1 Tax=Halalkalibacterium halodurans (strain ATCC BAA-125 / DSM 18197 / FERM 7344 / JCM 9153 / C-125) TaxID=272558 RepID=Q9KE28_HALH5|nr:signal peptidase (type I) [Halalkalibacterium halodurans C-125]